MEPILIDTNLLVYVFDRRDRPRQEIATTIVGSLVKSGAGRLSAQCLAEFFNATTKRKDPILSVPEAVDQTEKLARALTVYPVTLQVVLEAMRGVTQHRLPFWDAQIWGAARLNQIPTVFSDDFSPGTVLEGVRFVNPLASGFQLQDWLP
jgi:predicted nucleic acid-binding protein